MFRFTKIAFACLPLTAGLVLGGCQSATPSPDAMVGTPLTEGIACDKCKVTWVKAPTRHRARIVGYTTREHMVCPECKGVVENLFATGKFEHTCKACGGNMSGFSVH